MARLGLIFLTLLSHSRTHVAPSHNRTVDFDYFSTPYQIDSNAFQASSYREIATTHFALRISTCGDFFFYAPNQTHFDAQKRIWQIFSLWSLRVSLSLCLHNREFPCCAQRSSEGRFAKQFKGNTHILFQVHFSGDGPRKSRPRPNSRYIYICIRAWYSPSTNRIPCAENPFHN